MLNNAHVKKESYGNVNQILFAIPHQVSVGIVVSQELGTLDDKTGKKIVKAGTPVKGDLNNRTTPFTAADTTAEGVLLHDVDVTYGDNNATLLLFGFVNTNRIDETTRAKITEDIETALPMIKFVAC